MPVSAPSYFPPSRGNGSIVGITAGQGSIGARVFLGGQSAGNGDTVDDILVLGDHAAVSISDQPNFANSIVIGSQALKVAATILGGPDTIVGAYAGTALTITGQNTLIGARAFSAITSLGSAGNEPVRNVMIGTDVARYQKDGAVNVSQQDNVLIGALTLAGTPGNVALDLIQNVVIGSQAVANGGSHINYSISGCVLVGYLTGNALGTVAELAADSLTFVGANTGTSTISGSNSVLVGTGADSFGDTLNNTFVGAFANGQTPVTLSNCVLLGAFAGLNIDDFTDGAFVLELAPGGQNLTLMYGDFNAGSMVIGRALPGGLDRELPGTNILKLLNGTAAGTPTGGGFFYVQAGALHWVGSGGTDTVIAPA